MTTRAFTEQVKVGLAIAGLLAVAIGFVFARLRQRAKQNEAASAYLERTPLLSWGRLKLNARQTWAAALVFFCLVGTVNYQRYDTATATAGYDEYDLLHYYINAKYFDELGYFRLLPALLLADREVGEHCPGYIPIYLAEDENDYTKKPVSHAYAREKEVKDFFTDSSWKEFVHDSMYIQRTSKRLTCDLWRQLLQDHGFNGTPTWVLIARPITKLVPVEWIKVCTYIDLVLVIIALGFVLWAFGAETFALAWMFITFSYSFRWPHITWAFLRYDWLTTLVIGVCLARKEKYTASGAVIAYAALMRYFPALWLVGIVGKGVHAIFTRRDIPWTRVWLRVPSKYYRMALGFTAVLAVLLGLSFAIDGTQAHVKSLESMVSHVEPHNLSSMRQGLAIAATYRGETEQKLISPEKKALVQEYEKPLRYACIALIVLLCLLMTRLEDFEVIGLAVIPYFWLTTSSYYYYSLRLTAIVVHAADLSKWRNIVGLAMLFGIEIFSNISETIKPGYRYFLISWMGIALAAYSVVMMAFLGVEWWKGRKPRAVEPSATTTEAEK